MDFALSEDEKLIQDTARDFAQKKLFPRALDANRLDGGGEFIGF